MFQVARGGLRRGSVVALSVGDRFAVGATLGAARHETADTGWLGQPVSAAYQMIWLGTGPDASTNPGFETDLTSGWTFNAGVPGTLTRDPGTAAVGTASARVNVPAAGQYEWAVNLNTVGSLNVFNGNAYSATFWANTRVPFT